MIIDEDKQVELVNLFNFLLDCFPLGNWTLDLKFADSKEITHISGVNNPYACTIPNDNMQHATIYINTNKEYPDWDNPSATLIHEIIHIMHRSYDNYVYTHVTEERHVDLLETLYEQFINNMSRAIYNIMSE